MHSSLTNCLQIFDALQFLYPLQPVWLEIFYGCATWGTTWKRRKDGVSLTNCLEVKPPEVLLCTLPCTTRVVWSGQESRLGEMGITIQCIAMHSSPGRRMHPPPPPPLSHAGTMQSKSSEMICSAAVVRFCALMTGGGSMHCIALHCREMSCNAVFVR